jgi:hypothetical protein
MKEQKNFTLNNSAEGKTHARRDASHKSGKPETIEYYDRYAPLPLSGIDITELRWAQWAQEFDYFNTTPMRRVANKYEDAIKDTITHLDQQLNNPNYTEFRETMEYLIEFLIQTIEE